MLTIYDVFYRFFTYLFPDDLVVEFDPVFKLISIFFVFALLFALLFSLKRLIFGRR